MPYGNFKDIVISRLDGGLYTTDESSKIGINYTPDLLNIDFNTAGSIQTRRGIAAFGTQVNSLSGIKSLYSYRRNDGLEVPMRSWTTYLEYYNRETSAWTQLSGGFTTNLDFDFANYDGYVYTCNGVDAMFRWNGQYGTISAAHAASATVLECNELLTSWLSAGEAIIGTQAVYYGSRTSGTLSAMTGISAVIAANCEVAQAPTSSRGFTSVSSIPRGTALLTDGDRLFVAGVSSNWQNVYYSNIGDFTDFTYDSPRTDGQGGTVTIGDGGGEITAIKNQEKGNVLVFKRDSIKNLSFIGLDSTTTDFPKLDNVANSKNCGAIGQKGAVNVEGNCFFVSPDGHVRYITATVDGLGLKQLTEEIKPTVEDLDPTSAVAIYHNKKLYVSMSNDTSNYNDVTLVYDRLANGQKGAWGKYGGIYPASFMDFNNTLYIGAANEKTTYRINTGFDDNGSMYTCKWLTKNINHEVPHEYKALRYVYVEGYCNPAAIVSATCYYNGMASDKVTKVFYGTGAYVDPSTSLTFGDEVFGGKVFGGIPTTTDIKLYKFRIRLSYNLKNLFSYQLEFKSQTAGAVWQIDQIVPYVERYDGTVFPVSNII